MTPLINGPAIRAISRLSFRLARWPADGHLVADLSAIAKTGLTRVGLKPLRRC
jgi:hypothetical protein